MTIVVHRDELLRHPVYTRVLHWSVAICFVLALLSGLAIGIKVSALPTAVIVFALTAWRAGAPGSRGRAAVRVALVFAVAWTVTGGYWYVRNTIHTGNPLYPAAFLGWPGAARGATSLGRPLCEKVEEC